MNWPGKFFEELQLTLIRARSATFPYNPPTEIFKNLLEISQNLHDDLLSHASLPTENPVLLLPQQLHNPSPFDAQPGTPHILVQPDPLFQAAHRGMYNRNSLSDNSEFKSPQGSREINQ